MASLTSTFTTNTPCLQRPQYSHFQPRLIPKASLQHQHQPQLNRRLFISQTSALSLPLILHQPAAKAEEALSEWERVYLPIDPGVVLLDIAFVPDDLSHGRFFFF